MGAQNGSHVTLLGTLGHPLGTLWAPLALVTTQHAIFTTQLLQNPSKIVPKRAQDAQVTTPMSPQMVQIGHHFLDL